MTTVARLSVWVPPERMDEFEEVYERQLAPLLRPHGLQALRGGDPGGGGHPSAGAPGCGLASGAAATATDVWDGARPWAALAFRALSHTDRPRSHHGGQRHQRRSGDREPVGRMARLGPVVRPSVRDGPVGLSGPAGADVVRVHRGWGGRWDGQRFVNFSPDYEQMRED